jgi:hypothetical protein
MAVYRRVVRVGLPVAMVVSDLVPRRTAAVQNRSVTHFLRLNSFVWSA